MAKKINITDKLEMNGNPFLVVGEKELEVNGDAATVLVLMDRYGEAKQQTVRDVLDMYEIIFPEKTRETITEMHLSFNDLKTIIQEGMNLIVGDGEELGENQTPTMI